VAVSTHIHGRMPATMLVVMAVDLVAETTGLMIPTGKDKVVKREIL